MHRDNNYRIKGFDETDNFSYNHFTGYISLKLTNNNLSDNELLEYISDSLTHEHIHKTLDELFNNTVSRLFDGIEHFFRNNALHEREINYRNLSNENHKGHETYQSFIIREGFDSFLRYYDITQEDIIQANKTCSDRLHGKDLNQSKNITWKKLKEY